MADAEVIQEEKQETVKKTKNQKTGDLIVDIAHEVETYNKQKAISEAEKLAENVETSYFKLGGVLKLIKENSWYEGFESFEIFVAEKFGFQHRKAAYLIEIYDNLVTKQIPWEKVHHLGWTKLKDLAKYLTLENVDEWVKKAENLTVKDLQNLLNASQNEGEGEKTQKTSDEVVKITFKLKSDQSEIVSKALAKAKGELHTEYDTVALENICAGYLGGTSTVSASGNSLEEIVQKQGFEAVMLKISDMYPEYDIKVEAAASATA